MTSMLGTPHDKDENIERKQAVFHRISTNHVARVTSDKEGQGPPGYLNHLPYCTSMSSVAYSKKCGPIFLKVSVSNALKSGFCMWIFLSPISFVGKIQKRLHVDETQFGSTDFVTKSIQAYTEAISVRLD